MLGRTICKRLIANRTTWTHRSSARPFIRHASNTPSTDMVKSARPQVTKSRRWVYWLAFGSAVTVTGFCFLDLWVNDDFDSGLWDRFRTRLPESEYAERPKLVILGTGWGGMSMLRKLHMDKFDVTIISPRNYFLFTPLLASTTSGLLDLRSIVEPIRNFCIRGSKTEAKFIQMETTMIDPIQQKVYCHDASSVRGAVSDLAVDYDYLVVAVGAQPATFGIPGVTENAIFMKSIEHSQQIRKRVMDCFETASIPGQPDSEIDRLLHFIVVGGGPSGVEYTGELYDFVVRDLMRAFPEVANRARITLVEALPKILPMFDGVLIDYVEKKFRETRSINVLTKSSVNLVEDNALYLKKQDTGDSIRIPYGMLVWVTGNTPCKIVLDLIDRLGKDKQPVRRGLSVDEHLRVHGTPNIFALGDCALAGRLPATAQVASQEGHYLGRLFNQHADSLRKEKQQALLEHGPAAKINPFALNSLLTDKNTFNFHSFGSFAYIGQQRAIADFGPDRVKCKGVTTWMLWRSVYLSKLLSLRNRVYVLSDWVKSTIFGCDISRW